MKKQEAIEQLREIPNKLGKPGYDQEDAHIEADAVLTEYLRSHGHGEIVDAYEAIEKWYA